MDAKTMQKVINGMADKIDDLNDKMKSLGIYNDDKCDDFPIIATLRELEDKYKYMFNNEDIKHLMDKIDDLSKYCQDNKDKIIKLVDKTDDLEAKNYQLRGELDGIYKVLEMDACDIQKIQDKMEGK